MIGDSLGGAAALLGAEGPVPADALLLVVTYPDIQHAIRNRLASQIGEPLAVIGEPMLSMQSPLRFGVSPKALSPIRAIRDVHVPIFVIGGARDIFTPPAETRALYNAARPPKRLWIVAGAGHDQTAEDPAFNANALRFLKGTIG